MHAEISQILTNSIDPITRRWIEGLRNTPRTEIHKQLLTAEIVSGVKGMLQNLAQAILIAESPDGDTSSNSAIAAQALLTTSPNLAKLKTTRPLGGPLEQARLAAANLGHMRHRQGYEIQEVIYEFVKLRQEIWQAIRAESAPAEKRMITLELVAYIDRLLDELMLTTVENFYNTSVRELEKRAIRDPMTQLYNKEYFQQRLSEELRRSIRYAEPISVAMIDMDHLKEINDTYGHQAGDEVIKAIASAIRDRCRQTDVPCRYGGDEFAVILPETSKVHARAYAERVMQAVRSLGVVLLPGMRDNNSGEKISAGALALRSEGTAQTPPLYAVTRSVSIGLASFPEDARNPETLLAKADEALYRAKNEGRNRIGE